MYCKDDTLRLTIKHERVFKMPYEQTNITDEDATFSMDDLAQIYNVRRVVLEQLIDKQNSVDSEGVVWAELEGMIDCINNMYDPLEFLSGGENKWQ